MSWFSKATKWVVDDLLGIDLPDGNAVEGQLAQQNKLLSDANAAAKASADKALKAQSDANAIAEAASRPAIDSESARAAEDERRRRLTTGSAFGVGLPTKFGAPPVGFRALSGQ